MSAIKFFTGSSKKPYAKIYASKNGQEFTYYVYSKKSYLRCMRKKESYNSRIY